MRSCSLFSLFVALAVAGCDSAPAIDPPAAPPPVLPLAVGAEWTVTRTTTVNYERDGSVRDTSLAGAGLTVTLSVTRDTVVAGETWFRIESTRPFAHCVFDGRSWFTNRDDGLYRWQAAPADAERVYAIGVDEGVPFLSTDIVTAVLVEDDATAELPSGPVPVRRYERTWKRLEFNASIQGPIDPMPRTQDALSPTLGPIGLEVSYVRSSSDDVDRFQPAALVHFEIAPAEAGESARVAPAPAGAYALR